MDDFLNKLRNKFPDLIFEFCKPPAYLTCVLQHLNDVILCYNLLQARSVAASRVQSNSRAVSNNLSFTGNPLDVSCVDETLLDNTRLDLECDQSPLTTSQALLIKQFCNLVLKPSVPVVILCDGDIGHSPRRVLYGCQHSDNNISYSWADYHMTESTNLPSLAQMVKNHSSKVIGSNGKDTNCRVNFSSQSVLNSLKDINDNTITFFKLSVQFNWFRRTVNPPLDCSTNVSLVLNIKMDHACLVSMSYIWKQLLLLQGYVDIIEANRKNPLSNIKLPPSQFTKVELGFDNLITKDTVSAKIKQMLFEPGKFDDEVTTLTNGQTLTLSMAVDVLSRLDRCGLEFTDILWINLIGCDTFNTLQDCFKEVFKQIGFSSHVKLLRKTNTSRLAHLLLSNQLLFTSYTNPLELLVEMGIDRLRKELISIFDFAPIATSSLNSPSLTEFIDCSNSESWLDVTKGWLSWLARLYSSLNVLCCTEKVLNNPSFSLFFPVAQTVFAKLCCSHSSEAVESLSNLIINPNRSITVPISMDLIKSSSLKTGMFDDWKMVLNSNSEYSKVESVYYRSYHCPFPFFKDHPTKDAAEVSTTSLFNKTFTDVSCLLHCLDYHSISDSIFHKQLLNPLVD